MSLYAGAVTVESSPGSLKTLVDDAANVTELTVKGSLDASDFQFITSRMTKLRELNLSTATIAPYEGARVAGRSVHRAATVPAYMFAGSSLTSVELPAVGHIVVAEGAFAGSQLATLVIPANVVSVADAAFAGCTNLQSVEIIGQPELGNSVFASCTALKSVSMPQGGTLPDDALRGCAALESVIGADGLTSIGNGAMSGCVSLQSFDFGSNLTSIGSNAFEGAALVSVDLTQATSLQSIGSMAFAQMPMLETVNLGHARKVGDGVLLGCQSLQSVTLPQTVDSLPHYALAQASQLNDVQGLRNIATIGRYALSGASSMTALEFSDKLASVGDGAMERMYSLTSMSVDAITPPALGEAVWDGVEQPSVKLSVPQQAYDAYKSAEQWGEFHIIDMMLNVDQTADNAPTLHGAFDGHILSVWVDNDCSIMQLGIFAPSGVILSDLQPRASGVCIDTTPLPGNIFIIAAKLSNGSTATLKLAKNGKK